MSEAHQWAETGRMGSQGKKEKLGESSPFHMIFCENCFSFSLNQDPTVRATHLFRISAPVCKYFFPDQLGFLFRET